MSVMDFKLKGRAWAGNIYQKFEAMCQEVDDIVRQDKVKYVGSHVQNVGESVKKLYSDAVQDLFPPVTPVKHETQAETPKPNAVNSTHMESMISIEENAQNFSYKQTNVELNANDIGEEQLIHALSFSGLHFVGETNTVPSLDSIKQKDSGLPFGENGKFPTYNYSDDGIGKISSEEPSPLEDPKLVSFIEKRAHEGPLCSEFSNESHQIALGILTKVSPASPVHDDRFRSHQYEEIMADDIVDEPDLDPNVLCTLPSSGLEYSFIISRNENSEVGCSSSSCSLSTASYREFATSTDNCPEKTWLCCNRVDDEMSGENEAAEVRVPSSSVLSLESDDMDSSRISDAVTQSCVSRNSRDQGRESTLLEYIVSSSQIGRLNDSVDDLADHCMETIELDDEVKLGESCVIVDSDVLHAFSRRSGRLRSYKKLIQDAFVSKRRLAKEYEQLAIWYGDVDIRSSQHSSLDILPSFLPATSSDLKKAQGQDSRDSEWELL